MKTGAGTLVLSSDLTYTGATTVFQGTMVLSGNNVATTGGMSLNGGVTRFESAASSNGTGRSVTVANGAVVAAGYAIDNGFLNRLVENGNAFTVALAADSGNALDFNTSAGAILSGASLGATGDYNYTGVLTP